MFGRYLFLGALLLSFQSVESLAGICNSNVRTGIDNMRIWCGVQNSLFAAAACAPGSVYGSAKWTITATYNPTYKDTSYSGQCSFIYCNGVEPGHGNGTGGLSGCTKDFTPSKNAPAVELPINKCGSVIQASNQTLGEVIPVVGLSFNLNYFSNRVIGRIADYTIKIPITASTVHANATGYTSEIKNDLGSVLYTNSYGTGTNQTDTYLTDGLNGLGQETWGTVNYKVKVVENATDFPSDVDSSVNIGSLKNKKLGLGGWVPSIWYFYDHNSKILFKPDGTQRSVTAQNLGTGFYLIPEEDGSKVYIFDTTGKIVETKLGLTGQVVYSFYYDGSERLSYINEPFSKTTSFIRNGSGVLTSITAPNGASTTITHDVNGYLATVTNPESEVYEMTYHGTGGLLATFEKPNAAITEFTYDANGDLTKDEHSGGKEINLSKTTNVNGTYSMTLTSGMSRAGVMSVDTTGTIHKQEELKADSSKYLYEYYANNKKMSHNGYQIEENTINSARFGNLSTLTNFIREYKFGNRLSNFNNTISYTTPGDPFAINTWTKTRNIGNSSKYPISSVYTGSTKTTVTTTQLGKTTTTVIDNYQRPVSIQRGNLTPVEMEYTDDKLTEVSQGARTTTFAYNSTSKLLESVTNAANQTTEYEYNDAERLTKVTLPDSREINYVYDSQGNLTSITPPSKPAHVMTMGANEKLSTYAPPTFSGVPTVNTTYAYNLDNQLTQITRPDSQTIVYDYGATTGRLNKITVPAGDYVYTYGSLGSNISLPTVISSPSGRKFEFYYSYGVPYYFTLKNSSNVQISQYAMGVGDHAQLSSETVSGASGSISVSYTYNNDEMPSQIGNIALSYDTPNNQLVGTTLGNITDITDYYSEGELEEYEAKYSSTTIYNSQYSRDVLGRVVQKVEAFGGVTKTFDYTYDNVGRLTQVDTNGVTTATYTYDSNSNRNGGNNGTTITATYDDQDRMTAYKNHTFTYNANGDLTSKTYTPTSDTTTYTYDVFGNLTQVVLPSKTINYEIDPLNRRLGRSDEVTTKRFIYDSKNRLVGEMNSSNALQRRYVYASKPHVPDYFVDTSNVKYRIITDHLGSVRLVVKESDGTIMQQMEHDEFGRIVTDTNPGYQPFGFAGGLWDHETGLVRFGARDYDVMSGRWTSKDPIRFKGGDANLFGYVFNDPVNFVDPNGLTAEDVQNAINFVSSKEGYSGVTFGFGTPANADGLAIPFANHIQVSSAYRGVLTAAQRNDLLGTVYHEMRHVQAGTWNTLLGIGHDQIHMDDINFRDLYGNEFENSCK